MKDKTTLMIVRDYPDPRSFREFKVSSNGTIKEQTSSTNRLQFLYDLFLPIGYPDSVPDTYLPYQLYDSLQGLCSYLRGVLCAAAVLEAAGVGDATASAMSVAIQWVTKDGLGILGGLFYSYGASHLFDGHVKEFRLLADVANDIGLFLDMLAPSFRSHLLYISAASVLCKTICGISAGATKGSITQHFAIAGNMADLNAKEATQETLMSLIGMLVGVSAAKVVQSNWTVFIVLTLVHVWANWKGVMLLRMRTLNRARADIVFAEWIRRSVKLLRSGQEAEADAELNDIRLPAPDSVFESLAASFHNVLFPKRLELGVPLSQILRSNPEAVENLDDQKGYVLTVNKRLDRIQVSLLEGASDQTILQAFLHARLIQEGCPQGSPTKKLVARQIDVIFEKLRTSGWDNGFHLDSSKCRSSCTMTRAKRE